LLCKQKELEGKHFNMLRKATKDFGLTESSGLEPEDEDAPSSSELSTLTEIIF